MAIIQEAMQPGQAPAPQQPGAQPPEGPAEDAAEAGDEEVSDDEQNGYDKAMVVIGRMLVGTEALKDIAQRVATAQNPAREMGSATLDVVSAADDKLGGDIPETMLGQVAFDTLAIIAEAAEKAGAKIDGKVLAAAATGMIGDYLSQNGASPEQIKAALSEIDVQGMANEIDKNIGGGEQPEAQAAQE